MVKSMTGFGKATKIFKGKKVNVEIRSLNSKQLDLNLRIPVVLKEKESEIRGLLTKFCDRGKVDYFVMVESSKEEAPSLINKKLAKEYFGAIKKLAAELKVSGENLLDIVMKMPDVVKPERAEIEPSEWKIVKSCTQEALAEFDRFRKNEGKALRNDLEKRIHLIENRLLEITELDKKRIPSVRERLRAGLADLKENVDENRFEQELIFYIEKLDITEERVRLKTHCDYFLQTLKEENSGRKLNFISQEIGREINTIGSKANAAEMQKKVVQMKDELEKIKEQLNNVL